MTMLNVPYAEKDDAKRLGAKWDFVAKKWCVPETLSIEPFTRWLPTKDTRYLDRKIKRAKIVEGRREIVPPKKVDERVGRTTVGNGYVELQHDCNPFEECPVCKPILDASGWNARQQELRAIIAGLA